MYDKAILDQLFLLVFVSLNIQYNWQWLKFELLCAGKTLRIIASYFFFVRELNFGFFFGFLILSRLDMRSHLLQYFTGVSEMYTSDFKSTARHIQGWNTLLTLALASDQKYSSLNNLVVLSQAISGFWTNIVFHPPCIERRITSQVQVQ